MDEKSDFTIIWEFYIKYYAYQKQRKKWNSFSNKLKIYNNKFEFKFLFLFKNFEII